MENSFDFRKKLLSIHESNVRDFERTKKNGEFFLMDEAKIAISEKASEVIKNAAFDFVDFLKVSMGISAEVLKDPENADIKICLADECEVDLKDAATYRGFMVETNEKGINIYAYDECGAAQALYYIEDVMSLAHAPCVPFGTEYKKPLYSPQMVHSAYGIDDFPEEYLVRLAHEGRDAILIMASGINQSSQRGYLDFNEIIKIASKYGIKVYIYSRSIKFEMHPEEPGAEEYYDSIFGEMFRQCPGLAGVVLVGESISFPTNDKRIAKDRSEYIKAGIPTPGLRSSSNFPVYEYPIWLNILKKVIRKEKPDADIIFWTYNFGRCPEDVRNQFVEDMPKDISLQVTFEMFEKRYFENSTGNYSDYSIVFEGPADVFKGQAEIAKKRNIRLYSMTNTGGRTWDFGVVPYIPVPYQWMKRYEAMKNANEKWGLCGIMECHHYGFYPSFISKLAKWCFWDDAKDMTAILKKFIAGYYGEENAEKVDEAFAVFSEAIKYHIADTSDQYGALRVGPVHPLNLDFPAKIPFDGNSSGVGIHRQDYLVSPQPEKSPSSIRVPDELKSLKIMLSKWSEGVKILESIDNPNVKLSELINLAQFILLCTVTAIHAKEMFLLKNKLLVSQDKTEMHQLIDEIEKIILCERENVLKAYPLIENDSSLGYEATMFYCVDKRRLDWKLRQLDYVLKGEIPFYRTSIEL